MFNWWFLGGGQLDTQIELGFVYLGQATIWKNRWGMSIVGGVTFLGGSSNL